MKNFLNIAILLVLAGLTTFKAEALEPFDDNKKISGFAGEIEGVLVSKKGDFVVIRIQKMDMFEKLNEAKEPDLLLERGARFVPSHSPAGLKQGPKATREQYVKNWGEGHKAIQDVIDSLNEGDKVKVKAFHISGNYLVIAAISKLSKK